MAVPGPAHRWLMNAFNQGTRETGREIDFVALRQALAKGAPWSPGLVESLMPKKK